jgi:four helix bundle protein
MSSIICERAFVFAVRVLSVCERLCERGLIGRHVANQLLKAATSIGANAEEAQEGQTKPDFIAKMAVSRKESRETGYWLRLSVAAGLVKPEHVKWELAEAEQLRKMIRAAIITAQSSDARGDVQQM